MKAIWLFLKLNYPIWTYVSLVITFISLLFIVLADVDSIVSDSDVLFGFKAFSFFSLVLVWVWVVIVYNNRAKPK